MIINSFFTENETIPLVAFEQIDIIKNNIIFENENLKFSKNTFDLYNNFYNKDISISMGIEGHFIKNSLSLLRNFYDLGVFFLTLSKFNNNINFFQNNEGLTEFGKKVITQMNKLGMIIDLTGSNEDTIKQTLNLSTSPVIFSHSNSYSICNHKNNIKDEIFELIKKNEGIIQITFNPVQLKNNIFQKFKELFNNLNELNEENYKFLQKDLKNWMILDIENNSNLTDIIKHIEYIKNKIGIDFISIGSGFDFFFERSTSNLKKHDDIVNLVAELLRIGYSDEDVKKIFSLNFLRVLKKNELNKI
jgi:membrane dipeptidase